MGAVIHRVRRDRRGLRGSSEPHGLPVALAVLKLPTGAITAVLGLVLMRRRTSC